MSDNVDQAKGGHFTPGSYAGNSEIYDSGRSVVVDEPVSTTSQWTVIPVKSSTEIRSL